VYLAAVPIGIPFLFHLTRRSAIDRGLGELSYPLYLVHILIFPFLRLTGLPNTNGLLVAAGTIGAASFLYVAIQRPVDRWRHAKLRGHNAVDPNLSMVPERRALPAG
jgi:peptidoglycan/LPS O-acetylase OafA/YrhL